MTPDRFRAYLAEFFFLFREPPDVTVAGKDVLVCGDGDQISSALIAELMTGN